MTSSPLVLDRVRRVPTRALTFTLTFGGIIGLPAVLGALAGVCAAIDLEAAAVVCSLLAVLSFILAVVLAWVAIFRARRRLQSAEQALYAGDYETAAREAHRIVGTVFRSDYQTGALFTLALVAERIGAFYEAGQLFGRTLEMIPAMAARRPGNRARALIAAHAAICAAAYGDLARANAMLAGCHTWLANGQTAGPLDALLDDSSFGAIGINSILVELESRRDPRPLAVLAGALVAMRNGHHPHALGMLDHERASIEHGLAPHERALATRIYEHAIRHNAAAGPHRSAGAMTSRADDPASGWAALVVPDPRP